MMRTPDTEERQLAQEIHEMSTTAWMQSREHYARRFREDYPLAAAVLDKQLQPEQALRDPIARIETARGILGDVAAALQLFIDRTGEPT